MFLAFGGGVLTFLQFHVHHLLSKHLSFASYFFCSNSTSFRVVDSITLLKVFALFQKVVFVDKHQKTDFFSEIMSKGLR